MNWNGIDLRLLRGLVAIARAGTFAAAAQQLHLTQSALSQQMKELAQRLGSTLFVRQGRRAQLSDAGHELVQRVGPLIEQLDEALRLTHGAAQGVAGRLRVGATQTYLRALALPAAQLLITQHADLRLDLRQLPAQRLLADLLDGEIDLAIFPDTGPHGQLVQTPLLNERLAVIGTRDALARLGSRPRLKSLQERPLVLLNRQFLMRQQIDRQLRLDEVELDVRLEVSSMDDAITAALPGQLLAIGSPLACRDQATLSSRALQGRYLQRRAGLYWRRGRLPGAALLAFQAAVTRISTGLAPRA